MVGALHSWERYRNAKGTTERHAIADALWQTHWNRKATARQLQVSYRSLLYNIEQYRMSPSADHFPQYWNGGGFKGKQAGKLIRLLLQPHARKAPAVNWTPTKSVVPK